jgi:hypothetical protein
MFRFTIRDGLLALALVGVALAWWSDHRRLKKESSELRAANLELALKMIGVTAYPQGEQRITKILEEARQTPPAADVVDEVLFKVRHDPDFRIRVRAMAVLPYIQERERAIDALVEALHERDREKSADGVVPLYAAKYLAKMNASRAIDDVRSWLEYLKREMPYDRESMDIMIGSAERDLAQLEKIANPPP